MFRTDPFAHIDRVFAPVRPHLALDAVRRVDAVVVSIDLPGVARDDIDVRVDGRHLTITANRARPDRDDDDTVLIGERRFGSFHRTLRLADELDADELAASYVDGVLTITIPLRASATPRRVEIESGPAELQGAEAA